MTRTFAAAVESGGPARTATGAAVSLRSRLFGIDLRTLALFRVLLGIVLLYDIGQRLIEFDAMYTESGIMPQSVVRSLYGEGSWAWSLYFLSSASWFQWSLMAATLVVAAAIVVGYKTRWAVLAAWVLINSLHTRAPVTVIGGDVLLGMLLLWSFFLPLGRTWSIDAWNRPRPEPMILRVASGAIMGLMVAMYFMTGISKSNTIWVSGQALHNVFSYGLIARPFASTLAHFPWLLTLGSWWTLVIELAAPALFFSPWKTKWCRRFILLNFLFLHLAVEATMCVIIFSYISLAGLALFVDRDFWETGWGAPIGHWLDRVIHGGQTSAAVESTLWTRASNIVAAVLLAAVVFVNAPFFVWQGDFIYRLSPPARRVAELLGCCCRFDMFGTPAWPDYRFVAAAETEDGQVIDLLRDGAPVRLRHASELPPSIPSHRWLGVYVDLMRPEKAPFRATFARYLWERWHADHPGRPIKNVRLMVVLDRSTDLAAAEAATRDASANEGLPYEGSRGEEAPGILLAVYDPLVEGQYVRGRREGPFVMRHPNGAKAAEGRYRNDRPVGRWKYYDTAGRLEGEGDYVDGEMDGEWTFYYRSGKTSRAWYDRGRRIPPPSS